MLKSLAILRRHVPLANASLARGAVQLLLTIALTFLSGAATGVHADTTVIIPQNTKLSIVMQSDIGSSTSHTEDAFSATICEDLMIDGHVAWPKDATISGKIVRSDQPIRHMDAGSDLRLVFTSIQTPNSVEEPLNARLVSRGGVINFWRGTEKIQVDTTNQLVCGAIFLPPASKTAREIKPPVIDGIEPGIDSRTNLLLAKKAGL